jgi:hypothetical protein
MVVQWSSGELVISKEAVITCNEHSSYIHSFLGTGHYSKIILSFPR